MSGRIEVWEVFSYLLPPTSYLLKRDVNRITKKDRAKK